MLGAPRLRVLTAARNRISGLAGLARGVALERIDLSHNAVASVAEAAHLLAQLRLQLLRRHRPLLRHRLRRLRRRRPAALGRSAAAAALAAAALSVAYALAAPAVDEAPIAAATLPDASSAAASMPTPRGEWKKVQR